MMHGSSPPGNSVGWLLGSSPPSGLSGTSPQSPSVSFRVGSGQSTSGSALPANIYQAIASL